MSKFHNWTSQGIRLFKRWRDRNKSKCRRCDDTGYVEYFEYFEDHDHCREKCECMKKDHTERNKDE